MLDPDELLKMPALPAAEDSVFGKSENDPSLSVACLNFTRHDWSLYATGYKDAADKLVEVVEDTGRHHDTFVYPIGFLYRQYLELQLKNLIRLGRRLNDERGEAPQSHRLEALWDECHRVLLKANCGAESSELIHVGRLLREFAAVDPHSTAFRYPVDREGRPSLSEISHIDLSNVRSVVGKIGIILDGAECMLGEYLDIKLDIEREFAGEW